RLADIVAALELIGRAQFPSRLEAWLDRLDANGRYALLKLLTGAMRVGVSARLARTALAGLGNAEVAEAAEGWHRLKPPSAELFAWLEGRAGRPAAHGALVFRPPMLAHPLGDGDWQQLLLDDYAVEWKWDGIRVQVAASGGDVRLYSRTGDDISRSF